MDIRNKYEGPRNRAFPAIARATSGSDGWRANQFQHFTLRGHVRVLIDCTQISRLKAGVGVYAINLIRELIRAGVDIHLWLLIQDDDPDFLLEGENVTLMKVPGRLFRRLPCRFAVEQLYIPWLCRTHQFDVVHSLHYSFPLLPLRALKVVTVHDLTSSKVPEVHLLSKRLYYRFFLRASRRLADRILFVSRSTCADYHELFRGPHAPCDVTPLGRGPEFHNSLDPVQINKVLQKYRLAQPYVLYLGTLEPRKNLPRLVDAFAQIKHTYSAYTLVIAGKKGWMYEDLLLAVKMYRLDDSIIFTDFVAEADKAFLIRGAHVFVYPSLYEGFGLPVLEALACGTPTITSANSSMTEVAGDAAILVDPRNVNELVRALDRVLRDSELREALAKRGLAQALKFEWSNTAAQTYAAYRKAIGDSLD